MPVTEDAPADGPYDIAEVDVDEDGIQRVDLGGILISPSEGHELRLQVDEASQEVQSVMVAGDDGAVELRAFAAPRNGDLWSDVRRQIAAETSRGGGTATEREGRWGTELECQVQVRGPDGRSGTQPSRIVGINGNRWLLRATYLGRPAVEPRAGRRLRGRRRPRRRTPRGHRDGPRRPAADRASHQRPPHHLT